MRELNMTKSVFLQGEVMEELMVVELDGTKNDWEAQNGQLVVECCLGESRVVITTDKLPTDFDWNLNP